MQLTPQEFQKLLDRAEQLKKELAARKPAPPSGCAVRGRIEKRGEQLVAALKLTYSFRTTQPQAAVALGGKKSFLVAATLNGSKLPVLDTADDGFAVVVETAGDHSLALDVEVPVAARGAKETGFDLGLPRAPITTLALDPPAGVKQVTVATRTPDPAPGAKADTRRLTLDAKQLAAKPTDAGFPLGPIDSLEVAWEPAVSTGPTDAVQSAELDVNTTLTDGFVESTAKVKLRGPVREWKLVAPPTADVTVERTAGDVVPQQPVVTKPTDAAKPVWKIELPAGSTAADWTVTAVVRQARPKAGTKPAASPIGPFAVLDVLRQTGTVKVTAGPYVRFVFKHGADLRRVEAPDDGTAQFRLATGPTGTAAVNSPLLTVEAWPVEGAVRVKPTYKLRLTETGWLVRAEIAVRPVRTDVESLTLDVPTEWRGLESESDPDTIEGVTQGKTDGPWRPTTVRLTGGVKQPFALVFVATVPLNPNARELTVPLPRFAKAVERDTTVSASVPDGLEVSGTTRGWDGDQPAAWGMPLAAAPGPDGKMPKAVTVVTGRGERGLARLSLSWQPYRPDIAADIRTEATVGERQLTVSQVIRLRSPDGFPKPVRLRGPADALGLKASPSLIPQEAGAWLFTPPPDARDVTVKVSFALPLPATDAPASVPVGMLWPTDVARASATVRVWTNALAGRRVTATADGWRELPPEPSPDRDALPVLTLSASAERPLTLDLRPADAGAAAAVWVERALIEAGTREDGSVGYRARFRLGRWLAPAAEVALPDSAGPVPTVHLDGMTVAPLAVEGDGRRFRIPLPDGAGGRAVVLEIQYSLPGTRAVFGETTYLPPRLTAAAYSGPVRWLVAEPTDAAPFLFSTRGRAEIRWRQRGPTFAPTACGRGATERWFATGADPGPDDVAPRDEGEPVGVRQASPDAVRVARVPWVALVAVASLAAFLVLLLTTRLPASASAILITLLGGAFATGAVLFPQPAAQAAAAAVPGFAIGLLAILAQAVVRRRVRKRVANLPGFTRAPLPTGASSASAGTPSARSRSGSGGGAAPAPVVPSGS